MGLFKRREPDELAALPTLKNLPSRERKVLRGAGTAVGFAAGEVIVWEGAREEDVFLILEGDVNVMRGEDRVATLGPGDLFGEASFLTLEPRSATVIAASPLRALSFRFASINEVLEQMPEFATTMHGLMLLRAYENRERDGSGAEG